MSHLQSFLILSDCHIADRLLVCNVCFAVLIVQATLDYSELLDVDFLLIREIFTTDKKSFLVLMDVQFSEHSRFSELSLKFTKSSFASMYIKTYAYHLHLNPNPYGPNRP